MVAAQQETSAGESQRGADASSPYGLLRRRAVRFADRDLLVLPEAVRLLWNAARTSWTYGQALALVDALAARYLKAGYGRGHRVALLLENRPDHFFHWLALNAIGASVVPVNPDCTADELSYLIEHSESALLVRLAERAAQADPVAAGLGVAVADPHAERLPAPPSPALPASVAAEADECALIYTSGTTGRPKGCLLSNGYFLAWAHWYGAQGGLIALREGEERLMTPLPAFHVNAMGNSFMGMLGAGGAQVIVDRFHPRSWWRMAAETRATCFHYLGVMPAILLEIPPGPDDRAHGFRFGMGGGVHPGHHAAFEARFGVPLLEGWAMTESGGACIMCAVDEPRHVGERCIGGPDRAGPPMEIRIAGDEGEDVAPGTPGELLVRAAGPDPRRNLFSGYLKNDAATDEIWAGGWLRTGDVVRRGPDGRVHFVDRKKNIIRRSGENIAAIEVETAIAAHPAVAQVAVVAVLDPLRGEEVLAVVRAHGDAEPGEALARGIFEHCGIRLAYYKLPGYVVFLDEMPTTSTQKVRKADLGAVAEDPLSHPLGFDLRADKQAMRKAARP